MTDSLPLSFSFPPKYHARERERDFRKDVVSDRTIVPPSSELGIKERGREKFVVVVVVAESERSRYKALLRATYRIEFHVAFVVPWEWILGLWVTVTVVSRIREGNRARDAAAT